MKAKEAERQSDILIIEAKFLSISLMVAVIW